MLLTIPLVPGVSLNLTASSQDSLTTIYETWGRPAPCSKLTKCGVIRPPLESACEAQRPGMQSVTLDRYSVIKYFFCIFFSLLRASLVAQSLKHLPAMQETWVRKIPWRRKWQPTPVFLPGESHGRRSLVGYTPRGRKESDTTERLHFHFHLL